MTKTATKKRTPATATSRKGDTRDTSRTPTAGKASYKNPLASMSFEGKIQLNEEQKSAVTDIVQPGSITILTGKSGTGKTAAAMYAAFKLLKTKEVNKVYITRPTVEAGRTLGYLPGDLDEKYGVYLQPVKDFCEMLGNSGKFTFEDLVQKETLIPFPLQFMRGLTIPADGLLIIDEAQSTLPEEMIMALTRASEMSRVILLGDDYQKDTRKHEGSGLAKAVKISEKLEFIKHHELTINERSPRINDIIAAWEE